MTIQVYNHLSVDLVFDSTIPSIDVMQGDTARGLIVTYLTEIDNLDNSDVSAVIKVKRPDGMEGWAQGTVINLGADMAQVVIDPSDDYTALIDVPGIAEAVLEVYSGDTVVSTFKFRIDVKENPFYGTTIGSLTPKQLETVEQTAYSSAHDWMDEHPEASTTVQDGAISTAKLADNSVTSAKIKDGTIETVDLANGIVSALKLANTSVMENKVANIGDTYVMANGNTYTNPGISGNKLKPNSVGVDRLSFAPMYGLTYLGEKTSSSNTDYGSAIDISDYRFLLLMVHTDGYRILASTIIPIDWVTRHPELIGNRDKNLQAGYYQGTTIYAALLIFATATTVKIASWGSNQTALLYGIK